MLLAGSTLAQAPTSPGDTSRAEPVEGGALLFDPDEFRIPLWYPSFEVRGGFGYKDNVLLSHTNAQGSAFWMSGVEALVFRLPTDGWQFNCFLDATDVRYFNAESVNNEQLILAAAELTKDWGSGWKSALGISYMYQNQVFDFSTTYTNQSSVGVVRGHTLTPLWKTRKDLRTLWVEAELSATRQILDAPLDSFWLLGPRATIGRNWGNGSEVTLAYQWSFTAYDSREQVSAAGLSLTNTSLAMQSHWTELAFTYNWDQKKRWRTVSRAGFEANLDNGSGFYNYYNYRFAQEIRFRPENWEVKARGGIGYYDYLTQTVGFADGAHRRKTMVVLGLSAEHKFTKYVKAFASYSWERSISNLEFDDYEAGIVTGGLGVTF